LDNHIEDGGDVNCGAYLEFRSRHIFETLEALVDAIGVNEQLQDDGETLEKGKTPQILSRSFSWEDMVHIQVGGL